MIFGTWKIYAIVGVVIALVAFFGWTAIKSFPASLVRAGQQIQVLERKNELAESKIKAYMRAQERRDAAINASPCKAQIQRWMKNPDEVPGQFKPFEQLTPPNLREGNTPPAAPFDWPKFKWW